MVFEGIEKRQVFQGIAAFLKCCQILSRHTYISNGNMNLFFPYFPGFARCKRGVNCVRDGQKCLILQGKLAFVRGLPWQTNRIFVITHHPIRLKLSSWIYYITARSLCIGEKKGSLRRFRSDRISHTRRLVSRKKAQSAPGKGQNTPRIWNIGFAGRKGQRLPVP